ncbi:MAG: ANTAR domain-containing protein [Myxococcota bacterium]
MGEKLRILLVDEKPERASDLALALVSEGYEVVARLCGQDDLRARINALHPDVLIVDMQSPDRDMLEDMQSIHREQPRPVVMFVDESDQESIQAAVRAGVSAYVVDGLKARRVKPIVEVAIARFQEHQALRGELESVRATLAERKLVERAKGILMRRRSLGEDDAYQLLRRTAMQRKLRMSELARQVIDMEELL